MARRKTKGLSYERKWIWEEVDARTKKKIMDFCEGYKGFLDEARTERLAVKKIVERADERGFVPYGKVRGTEPGTKFYIVNRNKTVALVVLGKRSIEEGANIVASHIDAPRLDLKQNPLYEDGDTRLALMKTHYYGGIRKYHWVGRPLAIHGVVVKADGTAVEVHIGDEEGDPVFTIADLLPHLSRTQSKRRLEEGIKGEELNLLVGSIPAGKKDEKKKRVKDFVLRVLNERYGIVEEDLLSAELELVPAGRARDIGFDRSFVGAYGQDDRSGAYAQLMATLDIAVPERTVISLFVDKEEIGSEGNTGIKSRFLENVMGSIVRLYDENYSDRLIRQALRSSRAISSDVNAGVNPTFKDVHEIQNAALLGCGIVVTKFTGSGGKYLSNDAHAEYVAFIRRVFNENGVYWQIGELGKVDEGGGGTIAKYLANHDMDVIDAGPALLAMHSPFEIASKADIYSAYTAYTAFFMSA